LTLPGVYGIIVPISADGNEYVSGPSQRVRGWCEPNEAKIRKILPEPLTERLADEVKTSEVIIGRPAGNTAWTAGHHRLRGSVKRLPKSDESAE
jgi:hypothetical protein